MLHRHLNHQQYTLAAIDNVIGRGKREDWIALRSAVLSDPSLQKKIIRVCEAYAEDSYAQRYIFWGQYAKKLAT